MFLSLVAASQHLPWSSGSDQKFVPKQARAETAQQLHE
jgi:hypothetical protein